MTQPTNYRAVLEQALDALRSAKPTMWRHAPGDDYDRFDAAMTGIRAALTAGRAALETQGGAAESLTEAMVTLLVEEYYDSDETPVDLIRKVERLCSGACHHRPKCEECLTYSRPTEPALEQAKMIADALEHADSLRVVMQDQAAETIESLCALLQSTALPDHSEQHLDMVAALPVGELTDEQIVETGVECDAIPEDCWSEAQIEFARAILAAAKAQHVLEPLTFDITVEDDAAKVLRDFLTSPLAGDDDATPVRILLGNGHSGYGLYLAAAEYPEEGSVLIHGITQGGKV